MSRDYKSRKSSTSQERRNVMILGIFIGYTLGILTTIGIWFYLEQAPSPFLSEEQIYGYDRAFEHADRDNKTMASASSDVNTNSTATEEKVQFDYYKILQGKDEPDVEHVTLQYSEKHGNTEKSQSMKSTRPLPIPPSRPPPPLQRAQNKPADSIATEIYYLQVGSFRNNADADNLKAQLALLGVIASVQSANLSEKGVWHRVRIGPFTQKNQMEKIHYTLQENGIEAQFVKAR